MYTIEYTVKALKDLKVLTKNSKLLSRYLEILTDIKDNPYSPAFKFERLKHKKNGEMSKRLTQKDRVVYTVSKEKAEIRIVDIFSILGHYEDK